MYRRLKINTLKTYGFKIFFVFLLSTNLQILWITKTNYSILRHWWSKISVVKGWKLQVSVSNWYITHLASSSMAVGLARHHRKLFLSCGWGIEDGASSYRYGERGSTEGQVLFVTVQATQRHPCSGAGVFLLISTPTYTTAGPLLGWPTNSDYIYT